MPKTKIDIPMWLARFQRAEALQSEVGVERRQNLKLYTGTFFGKPTDNNEVSEVNFVYEFLKILIGSVYSRDPRIHVKSQTSRWRGFAETMETVLNYYWREKHVKNKIKDGAILDGVLQPPGFIEIGYTLLTEKNSVLRQIEKEFPELKDKEDKTEEEQGIFDETIKEDDIFVNHVSSWNVFWPDGYHDLREAPYIFKTQKIPLVDLLANPSYKDSKYEIHKGVAVAHTIQKITPYRMRDNPPPMNNLFGQDLELIPVTLIHVWDKRSRKRFTLAKNFREDTLFETDWDYFIDGFPIYPLIFNPIPQSDEKANSYPLSDIVPMIPQLKELSLISSAMNRHRKRAGTLIITKKGILKDSDITNIQNAHDLDIVPLDDLSEQALKGFMPPPLPNDFYKLRESILEDLMRVSGYNQLLANARGVETATESENVRAGALIRQLEKMDIIENFSINVARGMAGLIWQFIQDKNRISQIIGEPVNEEMWPALPQDEGEARKMVQRELHFEIEAGSMSPPKDEAVLKKQWIDFISTAMATFPDRIKTDLLAEQTLKKFDVKDVEDMIITYDQEEMLVAQKENELLAQGIPQLVSPNENHKIHIGVHGQSPKKSQQLDEHILMHAQNMERKNPQSLQAGDTRVPTQSTAPEISRQGVATHSDILGSISNEAGIGGEGGGG